MLFTVKGMWDKPPSGWDTAVPFLDPNNKGDKGKPKKEVLMQMFEYLVKVYQVSNRKHFAHQRCCNIVSTYKLWFLLC